jgi:hypothetical protein
MLCSRPQIGDHFAACTLDREAIKRKRRNLISLSPANIKTSGPSHSLFSFGNRSIGKVQGRVYRRAWTAPLTRSTSNKLAIAGYGDDPCEAFRFWSPFYSLTEGIPGKKIRISSSGIDDHRRSCKKQFKIAGL